MSMLGDTRAVDPVLQSVFRTQDSNKPPRHAKHFLKQNADIITSSFPEIWREIVFDDSMSTDHIHHSLL
jgi:hypothetical protein